MFYYQDCNSVGHWIEDDVDLDAPTWREWLEFEINHPHSEYNPVSVRFHYKFHDVELVGEDYFKEFEARFKKNPWFKKYIPEIEVK